MYRPGAQYFDQLAKQAPGCTGWAPQMQELLQMSKQWGLGILLCRAGDWGSKLNAVSNFGHLERTSCPLGAAGRFGDLGASQEVMLQAFGVFSWWAISETRTSPSFQTMQHPQKTALTGCSGCVWSYSAAGTSAKPHPEKLQPRSLMRCPATFSSSAMPETPAHMQKARSFKGFSWSLAVFSMYICMHKYL